MCAELIAAARAWILLLVRQDVTLSMNCCCSHRFITWLNWMWLLMLMIFWVVWPKLRNAQTNKKRIPSPDDANLVMGGNVHVHNVLHTTTPFTVRRIAHKTNCIESNQDEEKTREKSKLEKEKDRERDREKMKELFSIWMVCITPRCISFIREWFQVHCDCTDAWSCFDSRASCVMFTSPIAVWNVLELHEKRSDCET